jgi:hypothetical protein
VVGGRDLHGVLLDPPPGRAADQRADQAQLADPGADVEHAGVGRRREQLGGAHRDRDRRPVDVRSIAQLVGEHLVELDVGHRGAAAQRVADRERVARHRRPPRRGAARRFEARESGIPGTVAAPVERRAVMRGAVAVAALPRGHRERRSGHGHGDPRGRLDQIRTPTNALGQVVTVTPLSIAEPEVRRSSTSGDC